jgi:hypothetical protein
MKKIPAALLREGLAFTEAVYIDDDNLFVPAGIPVRKKDIELLAAWDIDGVFTAGEPVTAPAGERTEGLEKAEPPAGEEVELYRVYLDLIRRLDSVFSDISAAGAPPDPRSIDSIAADLLGALLKDRRTMIGYILGGNVKGRELAKSSVNTAILSALVSKALNFSDYRTSRIAAGALLHDTGMLRLPREIIAKRGRLSPEELEQMYTHPVLAYQIVSKELRCPEELGLIALQHHEHWDGQGYPYHIAGADIDTGARIVSVADAFEAMVSEKPYRNPMAGYQAMKNLLADNSRRFDPEILKTFFKVVGIYPTGSAVLLNSGARALVVDQGGVSPLRPRVRLLSDENGKPLPGGRIVDLREEKSLFITRALDPRETSAKNA